MFGFGKTKEMKEEQARQQLTDTLLQGEKITCEFLRFVEDLGYSAPLPPTLFFDSSLLPYRKEVLIKNMLAYVALAPGKYESQIMVGIALLLSVPQFQPNIGKVPIGVDPKLNPENEKALEQMRMIRRPLELLLGQAESERKIIDAQIDKAVALRKSLEK